MPQRISPTTFPISAAATAVAYDYVPGQDAVARDIREPVGKQVDKPGQQTLFESRTEKRIIPFDLLTTPAERESIRDREKQIARPAPLKTEKVSVNHARPQAKQSKYQRRLEFQGQEEVLGAPRSNIICDAPVAPVKLRLEAAIVDILLMAVGSAAGLAMFMSTGGEFSLEKHTLPFLILAAITVPLLYKTLWTFAGRDTIGMQKAGLRLVDFDGNPPSQRRRYQRLAGGLLSVLAAGIGLIWSFVDEDNLTWHDHISDTFPTFAHDTSESHQRSE